MMLIDVKSKGLTGAQVEKALDVAHITVNKNGIPYDTEKPMVTSGIRIGTPAMTTRGMKEKEMEEIGKFILRVIDNINNESELLKIKEEVKTLCSKFPLYQ